MSSDTEQPDELTKLRAVVAYVIQRMEHAMRSTDKEDEAAWLDDLLDHLKGATEPTSALNPTMREYSWKPIATASLLNSIGYNNRNFSATGTEVERKDPND